MAKLLGGAGGKNGVFPQLPGINRGLFRDFEKDVAEYVLKKGPVNVDIKVVYGKSPTRPDQILYDVSQNGKRVLFNIFDN
ncbi:DNA/RNA non-specific endonuclease [Pseudomonas syringae]